MVVSGYNGLAKFAWSRDILISAQKILHFPGYSSPVGAHHLELEFLIVIINISYQDIVGPYISMDNTFSVHKVVILGNMAMTNQNVDLPLRAVCVQQLEYN